MSRYDVVALVDDSPSMIDLWDETRTALMGLVERCVQYDRDGIGRALLCSRREGS